MTAQEFRHACWAGLVGVLLLIVLACMWEAVR